jgi:hypothetical protein
MGDGSACNSRKTGYTGRAQGAKETDHPCKQKEANQKNVRRRIKPMRNHRLITLFLITLLTLTALANQPTAQAQDEQCFDETGYCVSGRFLEYWQQNGGLAVFGYPISEAQEATNPDDGQTYLTQWFERNRLELHPENEPPYDVLLGALGKQMLANRGIDLSTIPTADPSEPHYFGETGQAVAPEFWDYWSSHGLEFDGAAGTSIQESLALFGYPITPARRETSAADGQTYLTQWFERARFELHPENDPPYDILLGLLGQEMVDGDMGSTAAQPTRQAEQPAQVVEPGDPAPTTEPAPSGDSSVTGPCATNAPPATNGSQVWMTNTNLSPGDEVTVCGRLILNGQPQQDVFYTIQLFYGPDYEPALHSGATDEQGIAIATFTIEPNFPTGTEIRADAVFADQPGASVTFTLN